MIRRTIHISLYALLILSGILALGWWLLHDPTKDLHASVPGMDRSGKIPVSKEAAVNIGESFTFFRTSEEIPGPGWPRFRGSFFDNVSREKIRLIENWGSPGPRILWKIPLGEGHAAPAIYNGRVYILDYDEVKKSDALRCFSLKDGQELWRRSYRVHLKRNHGLSRTIPAVNEKYVVTIGPRCQVMCLERKNGNFLWGVDLAKTFGTEVPFWYTGQCPLLEGDTAIIAPGGRALMITLDCRTGKTIWETPNLEGWKMSHSSVMPFVFRGKKMYVYFAIGGVCGISASGTDRGKLLWKCSGFSPAVVAPSPLPLDNGRILLTAGYGAGTALLQVREENGSFSASILQQFRPQEGLASEQQTPVYYRGMVWAIMPKDAGGMRNQFVGILPGDAMKILVSSGKQERFGLGPYLVADDKFFIVDDDASLVIARASREEFRVLDRTRIFDGQDAWGPLALSDGFLLMRDSKQLVCLDLHAK